MSGRARVRAVLYILPHREKPLPAELDSIPCWHKDVASNALEVLKNGEAEVHRECNTAIEWQGDIWDVWVLGGRMKGLQNCLLDGFNAFVMWSISYPYGCQPKNRGIPKWMVYNNGKPY